MYAMARFFSPDELGTLKAKVKYPSSHSSLCGDWIRKPGNRLLLDSRSFLILEPITRRFLELTLEGAGLITPTASPENVQNLNEAIKSFAWYPVLSIGVGIRL